MISVLKSRRRRERRTVVVVGGGAAGVGVGVALRHAGIEDMLIVDRHGVGASFDRWPKETTFLTPSFPTNSIGMLDLNAVAIGTSPAHLLGREHPSGQHYAAYLRAVAEHFELPIRTGVDVRSIESNDAGWRLHTARKPIDADVVVWAAGEFQYPREKSFPGAHLCRHNSTFASFRDLPDDDVLVIGGYESGLDAGIQCAALGKQATVLARGCPWERADSDPSVSISTYTRERLRTLENLGAQLELVGQAAVSRVRRRRGRWTASTDDGREWTTGSPPILATGFRGSHGLVSDWFECREDGYPQLTTEDESTLAGGLFFVGPLVRHDEQIFCFIYKFRQRFAVVAKAIANRLGLLAEELEGYRAWGMYLDDLSCCGAECVC
ncbi:MAG: NAD(P)/FAD-dependent oxidoreductase [Planctomycetaceae bacterium]